MANVRYLCYPDFTALRSALTIRSSFWPIASPRLRAGPMISSHTLCPKLKPSGRSSLWSVTEGFGIVSWAEFPGPDQVARRQTSDTQQLFMEAYADCLPASEIDGKQRRSSRKRVARNADLW